MKFKRVVAVVVSVSLAAGAIGGGIYAYKSYQKKNLVVEVAPVASLNFGYYGDSETSYGMVTNDSAQEIYLEDSGKVEEVFVEEGTEVKTGDKLFRYDTSEIEIDIKRKELDLATLQNNIAIANHVLERLKQTKPIPEEQQNDIEYDYELEQHEQALEALKLPERDEKDNRIFNYVTEDSIAYNADTADGSEDNPYIFYCNKGVYAYGSFFNAIRPDEDGNEGIYVKFIICKKDASGQMVFESATTVEKAEDVQCDEGAEDTADAEQTEMETTVHVPAVDIDVNPNTIVYNGNALVTEYDDDGMWSVFTGEEVSDSVMDFLDELEEEEDFNEEEVSGYTQAELIEAINEKEYELKKMDLERRQQELQLQSLKETVADGIVYAKIDGVVKTVGDTEGGDDGAFMVVTGDEGLYVKGTISELLLDEVKPGTIVTANSWETGNTFDAVVTEILDYPVEGNSFGEGNPNVSYYEYTAYIEDSSALKNGEYVDLAIATNQTDDGEGIYLEKAYVREEEGRSYCMIADENGLLKKQYVVTGKSVYGSAVEIKSGLTSSDLIAFPYGKNAVEGAAVTEESEMYY